MKLFSLKGLLNKCFLHSLFNPIYATGVCFMQAHGWNNVTFRSYYTVSLSLMVDQNDLSAFVSMVSPVSPLTSTHKWECRGRSPLPGARGCPSPTSFSCGPQARKSSYEWMSVVPRFTPKLFHDTLIRGKIVLM